MKKQIILVTGPIASGKDELCKILSKRGFYIIDADKIGHQIMLKAKPAYKKILKAFGKEILTNREEIDRHKLAAVVFSNKKLLKLLNSISHPIIVSEIKRIIQSSKRRSFVINAALAPEMKISGLTGTTISVLAKKSIRLMRLMSKRKMSRAEALKRINAQSKDRAYIDMSDIVIRNERQVVDLKERVHEASRKL